MLEKIARNRGRRFELFSRNFRPREWRRQRRRGWRQRWTARATPSIKTPPGKKPHQNPRYSFARGGGAACFLLSLNTLLTIASSICIDRFGFGKRREHVYILRGGRGIRFRLCPLRPVILPEAFFLVTVKHTIWWLFYTSCDTLPWETLFFLSRDTIGCVPCVPFFLERRFFGNGETHYMVRFLHFVWHPSLANPFFVEGYELLCPLFSARDIFCGNDEVQ